MSMAALRYGFMSATDFFWQNVAVLSGELETKTSGGVPAATALVKSALSQSCRTLTVNHGYSVCSRSAADCKALTSFGTW